MKWVTDYMKCDLSKVIFTDECHATLDGPDGFSRGWIGHGFDTPFRLRRQQGDGGIMFLAGVNNNNNINNNNNNSNNNNNNIGLLTYFGTY